MANQRCRGSRFGRSHKRTFSTDSLAAATFLSVPGTSTNFAGKNPSNQTIPAETNLMKMKKLFLTLFVLGSITAVGVQAATISQTIANINADANKPGGPERVLKSISASTHVPAGTLEKEKAKSGLSYGEVFMAHSIASASGKNFDQIAALKAKGQSWDKIAADNNVSPGGKKVVKQEVPKPTPTPPQKTLREEQAERFSGTFQKTNPPKKP